MFPRWRPPKFLGYLAALATVATVIYPWSQNPFTRELLAQPWPALKQRHQAAAYEAANNAAMKIQHDMQLSVQEERVFLHLPKRGFPWLAQLAGGCGYFDGWAFSMLFRPDDVGMVARVAVAERGYFLLLQRLAPSPEAMRVEKQAHDLALPIFSRATPTKSEFLDDFKNVRALFDQLKGLPQMSAEAYAREREESAVMTASEYLDDSEKIVPPGRRKWPYQQFDRQSHWDRAGFLFAYSECVPAYAYQRLQMVVKRSGGIFEAEQAYNGSHFNPGSYESKLLPAEMPALASYLTRLPPSDASGDDVHHIVSFFQDGRWTTRTYKALPSDNPFQPLLMRMLQQSVLSGLSRPDGEDDPEFLKPAP